jgi:hypothetical protein
MTTYFRHAIHLVALSTVLVGCNSSTTAASDEFEIAKLAGDQQIASPGAAVEVAPTVKITDASGAPVSGMLVYFTVTLGGGNVSGGITRTDPNGIAAVGNWHLGALVGTNSLKVMAEGVDPVFFSATAFRASPGGGSN